MLTLVFFTTPVFMLRAFTFFVANVATWTFSSNLAENLALLLLTALVSSGASFFSTPFSSLCSGFVTTAAASWS